MRRACIQTGWYGTTAQHACAQCLFQRPMKPRDSLDAHALQFAPRHMHRDRRVPKLNLLIEPSLAGRLARGCGHQPFEAVYLTAASARGSPHPPTYTPEQ